MFPNPYRYAYYISFCKLGVLSLALLGLLSAGSSLAQAQSLLAEFSGIHLQRVKSKAFVLKSPQTIKMEAKGTPLKKSFFKKIGESIIKREYSAAVSAWVINADTRKVVWELRNGNLKVLEEGGNTIAGDKFDLPAGKYEVYVYPRYYNKSVSIMGLFDYDSHRQDSDFNDSEIEEFFRDVSIRFSGNGDALGPAAVQSIHSALRKQAIVSIEARSPKVFNRQGFRLDRAITLRIYCLGEIMNDDRFDFGWIENAHTGERVWQLAYGNSQFAGGADKNRYANTTLHLDAGSYVACYVSDDSHYNSAWNAAPPYDPDFWGLAVFAENQNERNAASLYDYRKLREDNRIAALLHQRDNAFESVGFALARPLSVRIQAMGEGRWGKMYDFGWIVDLETGNRVWEMGYANTVHAGGTAKNRMCQERLTLPAGKYMLYYVTDDSHAYGTWNAAPPHDTEQWGISIYAADEQFDKKLVSEVQPEKDRSTLVQITKTESDGLYKRNFELSRNTNVRIYAIGEGSDGHMYDYAWIENESTGRVVWEMTYRTTEHAGGAAKNRLYKGTLLLPRGRYAVFYKTDDSHAFGDWNEAPPFDAAHWGITVSEVSGRD